jgi:superfamily II DNA or RNA helicase
MKRITRARITLDKADGVIRVTTRPPAKIPIRGGLTFLSRGRKKGEYHCMPMDLSKLISGLEGEGFAVENEIGESRPLSFEVEMSGETRPYQEQAYLRWSEAGYRGVVVMPTGSGKTYVALRAIQELAENTVVFVPTIDLMTQWHDNIREVLGLGEGQVSRWGGGLRELGDITVMTYESGTIHSTEIADRFGLMIFDEVHHLPAESYRTIAELNTAAKRLGLTATPERVDRLETDLDYLVGKVVYSISKEELERKSYVASYRQERILVDLTPEEREEYEELWSRYRTNLRRVFAKTRGRRGNPIRMLVRRLAFDENARVALESWRRARRIALEADSKVDQVERLLKRYRDRKILIFSEFISIVNRIARKFGMPKITSQTRVSERKKILEMYREGKITKLVSGKVLDEGVDVPDASVGIIVSGSSTKRQYIQRLGRILRPKDVQAVLIEIVSRKTTEMQASERRKRPVKV